MPLDIIISLFLFIFILGLVVLVHEFGHFILAKYHKVKVEEFAFGFGKMLFGRRKGETLYRINLFPVGGYVKILGEEADVKAENSFSTKSIRARFTILIAGVIMNILLAVFLFYVYLGFNNFQVFFPKIGNFSFITAESLIQDKPYISEVTKDYPAQMAGIPTNSLLWAIDGKDIINIDDFRAKLKAYSNQKVKISIYLLDSQSIKEYELLVDKKDDNGNPVIGVLLSSDVVQIYKLDYSKNKILSGFSHTYNTFFYTLEALGQIIKISIEQKSFAPIADSTASIVKVGQITYKYVSTNNLVDIINLVAAVNISLAFINILPIPAMDGGQIMFLIIEKIRKKKISDSKVAIINLVSFIILLILSGLLIFKDILSLGFVQNLLHSIFK